MADYPLYGHITFTDDPPWDGLYLLEGGGVWTVEDHEDEDETVWRWYPGQRVRQIDRLQKPAREKDSRE